MKFEQQNLLALIELIQLRRSPLDAESLEDLERVISPLDDEVETLSNAATRWYQNDPEILDAQFEQIEEVAKSFSLDPTRLPGNVTEVVEPEVTKADLIEAIQGKLKSKSLRRNSRKRTYNL